MDDGSVLEIRKLWSPKLKEPNLINEHCRNIRYPLEYPEIVCLQLAITDSRITQFHGVECKESIELLFLLFPNVNRITIGWNECGTIVKIIRLQAKEEYSEVDFANDEIHISKSTASHSINYNRSCQDGSSNINTATPSEVLNSGTATRTGDSDDSGSEKQAFAKKLSDSAAASQTI